MMENSDIYERPRKRTCLGLPPDALAPAIDNLSRDVHMLESRINARYSKSPKSDQDEANPVSPEQICFGMVRSSYFQKYLHPFMANS